MISTMKVAVAISWLLVAGLPIFVASGPSKERLDTPEDIVREFCQLDFDGVVLSGSNPDSSKYKRLITGEDDEPFYSNPYELVFAASGFEVTSVSREESKATVEVTFKVLGQVEVTPPSFTMGRRRQVIKFRLLRVGNEWRIAPGDYRWYVSPSAIIRHFRGLQKTRDSSWVKAEFEKVIQQLITLEKEAKKRP